MPLLYGEGDRAFVRLQEEIIKDSTDQSIFACSSTSDAISGCFASCPRNFAEYANIGPLCSNFEPYSMTNIGLSIRLTVLDVPWDPSLYVVILNCGDTLPRKSNNGCSYGYVVVQITIYRRRSQSLHPTISAMLLCYREMPSSRSDWKYLYCKGSFSLKSGISVSKSLNRSLVIRQNSASDFF